MFYEEPSKTTYQYKLEGLLLDAGYRMPDAGWQKPPATPNRHCAILRSPFDSLKGFQRTTREIGLFCWCGGASPLDTMLNSK
jgi:hypothetical protein